jgi:hypothetical protein
LKLSKKLGCGINKYLTKGQLKYIDTFSDAGLDWLEDELPFTEETSNLWV